MLVVVLVVEVGDKGDDNPDSDNTRELENDSNRGALDDDLRFELLDLIVVVVFEVGIMVVAFLKDEEEEEDDDDDEFLDNMRSDCDFEEESVDNASSIPKSVDRHCAEDLFSESNMQRRSNVTKFNEGKKKGGERERHIVSIYSL